MLGDFNKNALDAKHQDKHSIRLARYAMGIHTLFMNLHILVGALLGHFHVKENFLPGKKVDSLVTNVYFSDHDALQVKFSAG